MAKPSSIERSVPGLVLWSLLGGAALLLNNGRAATGHEAAQLVMSLLALTFGLWAFWQHGGRQITAAGVYSIASAMFVGFAGLYWWRYYGAELPGPLFSATAVCFFSHVAMYYLFWHRQGLAPVETSSDPSLAAVTNGGVTVGASLTTLGIVAAQREVNPSLTGPAAFAGVVLMATSLFARRRDGQRLGMWRLLAVGIGFLLYARYVFTGYGRLNLAVLILAVGVAACLSLRGRLVKTAAVVGAGPALLVFVQMREAFGREINGSGLSGIGSVVSPLAQFAAIPEYVTHAGPSGGDTFWAALVTQVPSEMWPEKPPGFGVVLAQIFAPQVVAAGGSLAALTHGEWVYDFGWVGIPAMVALLGCAILLADRWLRRSIERPLLTRGQLLSRAAAIIVASGMADLLWVGSQTFSSRAGTRVIILGLVFVLWGSRHPTSRGEPTRAPSSYTRQTARR